jgi:uncharacterized membrane-anchored protein
MEDARTAMNTLTQRTLRKVPEITAFFWIIKLLTTAMGEATSDYLDHRINPVLAGLVGAICLVLALCLQFYVKKYIAWVYWLAVSMVAVFGTLAADGLHVELHVPYVASTTFFAVVLVIVFITWQRTEKTLSIHSITSRRREFFYWAAVMSTFALGTAAGDMTATTLGLGYFSSALLFAGLILIPAIGYWLFSLNEIAAFWIAYVLTRPLGASFADWFGVPKSLGGLGFGRGPVSVVLTFIIICFVIYLSISRIDTKDSRQRQRLQ